MKILTPGGAAFEFTIKDIKDFLYEIPLSKIKDLMKSNNDKDKIGILVAIKTEHDDEKQRVENDLIRELNNFLNSKNLNGIFKISILDKNETSKIDNTNFGVTLKKKNSHLIIYGIVKKRSNKGVSGYSLKLEAGVAHNPIPVVLSGILSSEFSQLFPRERYFPIGDELLGFEVTAEWLGLSIEYMIGVAFHVSSNFGASFLIFSDLQQKLSNISKSADIEAVKQLKVKVPARLVDISLSICALLYNIYSYKRDKKLIAEAKTFLDIIDKYNPSEERMKNLASIYYLLVEENVDRALEVQKEVKGDPIQPYNLGFLYFMKEQIHEGMIMYLKALKREVSSKVFIDLESFIDEYINKYPNKIQLYFASAIINYRGKEDFKLARKDFKIFIKLAKSNIKYAELVRLSKIYMQELLRKANWVV
jgi:hypothetical protein